MPELPTGTCAFKTRVPVTPLVGGVGVVVAVAGCCWVALALKGPKYFVIVFVKQNVSTEFFRLPFTLAHLL